MGLDEPLYMRRMGQQLQLSIEHRAAPGRDWFPIAFRENPPALEVVDQRPASTIIRPSSRERIEAVLADAREPLSQKDIRDRARMRASDVVRALTDLLTEGRVIRSPSGYQASSQ